MRVAFYAPLKAPDHPVPSGDRRVARLILKAIKKAGHDVFIASRMRAFDSRGDTRHQNQIERRGRALAERFVKRHRDNPPDLWFTYHLYHKAPDWIGPAVAKTFSIPYVLAEASIAPKQAGGPWASGHEAVRAAIRYAAHICVMNPEDRECLAKELDKKVHLSALPPFIDTDPPRAATEAKRDLNRSVLQERFGIPPSNILIAVTAMMRSGDKLESYRTLGRTMAHLRDLSLTWLVAGDGPGRDDVVAAMGKSNVIYFGALDRAGIDNMHAAADLAVWPAYREAIGMALLEAQASGLPVVAGRTPGVAQIVEEGITGLLTTSGDDTMLALAIRRLVDEPALRLQMRSAAMNKARREHDIASATRYLDRVLEDAIRRAAA